MQTIPLTDFDCGSLQIEGQVLSYLESGGEGQHVHFYHANGFPVSTYLPFLELLTEQYNVLGLGIRGQDGQSEGPTSWLEVADDLIHFLDSKNLGPIIGIGHSIGAVATLFASIKRPDLFSKIVLIDPVLIPWRYIIPFSLIKMIGRKDLFFLAKLARKRRSTWESKEEAYSYFKEKPLFSNFEDDFLRSYVTYGLKPSTNGEIELVCPSESEARIFESYPLNIWFWVSRNKTPTLILRGEHSDTLNADSVKRFCRKSKQVDSVVVEGAGHLIPMEKPTKVVELIKQFA